MYSLISNWNTDWCSAILDKIFRGTSKTRQLVVRRILNICGWRWKMELLLFLSFVLPVYPGSRYTSNHHWLVPPECRYPSGQYFSPVQPTLPGCQNLCQILKYILLFSGFHWNGGIELKTMPHNFNLVSVWKLSDGCFIMTYANVTERAHDVAPNVNLHFNIWWFHNILKLYLVRYFGPPCFNPCLSY